MYNLCTIIYCDIGTAVEANTEVEANGSLTVTGTAAHSIQLGHLVNNGTMVIGQAEVHPGRKAISIDVLENNSNLILFDSYVRQLILMDGSNTEIRMPAAYTPTEYNRVDSVIFQAGSLRISGGDFGSMTYADGVSFTCDGGTFETDPRDYLTQESLAVFYDGSRYIVGDPLGTVNTADGTSHPFDTLDTAAAAINGTESAQYVLSFRKSGSVDGNAVINAEKRAAVEIPQKAELNFSGSITVNGSIEFGREIGKLNHLTLGGSGTVTILSGSWKDLTIQSSSLLVSIIDGTFDGTLTVAEDARLTISGGSFAKVDGLSKYLAEGKRFRKDSDGYFHIVDFQKNILVNADEKAWFYENLTDAIADALANGWENPVFTLLESYTETTNPTFTPELKGAVLELNSFLILGDFTLTSECPLEIRGGHIPNGTVVVKDGLTLSSEMAGIHTLVLERGSGYRLSGDFYAEKLTVGAWVVESEISGGTYHECIFLSKPEGLTITGGRFGTDPSDHCTVPENKHFVKNDAYYELADHYRLRTVIGGQAQSFFTLSEAMAAIAAGKTADAHTLTMLDDCTMEAAVTVPAGEHLTYDQNGFTTTAAEKLFTVLGTLDIIGEGTMYTAGEDGILLDVFGSLNLNGGMLNGGIVLEDNASIHTVKDADVEVNCPGFALTVKGSLSPSQIQGGTFVGGKGPINLTGRHANLDILGGKYSADVAKLVPDTYLTVKIQDSPERWEVRYMPVRIAETGKRYITLSAAASELLDGQTIQLLDSITLAPGEGDFTFGEEITSMTLDLNGKTAAGALTFRGADAVVKNGTVASDNGTAVTAWGLNLTMEKVQSKARTLVSFQDATTYDAKNDIYYVEYTPERQHNTAERTQENEFIAVYELPTAKIEREKTAYYYSLEDALKDMKADEQVILLRDVTLTDSITLSTNGSIRLNEHTVTVEADSAVGVQVNADITLIGQTENPGGLLIPENSKLGTLIAVGRKGKLNVVNARVDASHISSAVTVQGGAVAVPAGAYTYISGREEDIHMETGTVTLSGGYFLHPVPEAFCANGYLPIEEPIEGWYTVRRLKYNPLALYSTLPDGGNYSLAKLEGGGRYYDGQQVTIKAGNVLGMRFTGWYECTVKRSYSGDLRIELGDLFSADQVTTLTMKDEPWNLTAVYGRIGSKEISLTVIAAGDGAMQDVTVNGVDQTVREKTYYFPFGTEISLISYAENFRAWLNYSNKIVSTQPNYHFTLVSDAVITMDANIGSDTDYAYVEFVSAYNQVISSERWWLTEQQYQLPPIPNKVGGINGRWSLDGKTEATIDDIWKAVQKSDTHYVQVKAIYDQAPETHTITVYEDGVKREQVITLVVGNGTTVTAKQIEGKRFSYWAVDAEGKQVLSYNRSYFLMATKDVELYAIYDVEVIPEPIIVVSNFYADAAASKLKIEVNRTIPDGYELLEFGILRTRDAETGTIDHLKVDAPNVTKTVGNFTLPNGVYTLTLNLSETSKGVRFYVRGYVIARSKATDEVKTYYSDIAAGVFNEMVLK